MQGAPVTAARQARYPLALAYCSAAFLAGDYAAGNAWPSAAVPVAGVVAALVPLLRRRWALSLLLLCCAVACACGTWRYQSTAYHDGASQIAHYAGQRVVIIGVVDGEPQAAGLGENLSVAVESVTVHGRALHAGGRILLHYTGAQRPEYGDRLSLTGTLQTPHTTAGFDYAAYLAHQGIHAVLDFPLLTIQARGAGNPVQSLALGIRDTLRRAIDGMLPHDEAALLIGILLGAPTRTLGRLTAPYITAGMIHVVAISGLKVALVAGTLSALCARLPVRIRWLPAVLGVALYALVSGATPSGVRAALMWCLAIAALAAGRRSYVWVSLAVVAAAMTFWNPLLLWDIGFQLSIAGTAGIVAFTPWFEARLRRLPPVFRESTAVTFAAQIATLPITAAGFGQVSFAGPIANGLLLPTLGPIMVFGGAAAIAAAIVPPLGHLLAFLVYPWLAIWNWAVPHLAAFPVAALSAPTLPVGVTIAYGLALIFCARRLALPHAPPHTAFARLRISSVPLLFLFGCCAVAIGGAFALARVPSEARMVIAGSGNGVVLLLQAPNGATALLDGGTDTASLQALLGERLPFWQRDLSAVLVSEPDSHHLPGLLGLDALYTVRRSFDPGAIYPSVTYAHWRAELRDSTVRWSAARTGLRIRLDGRDYVDVLQPAALTLDQVPAPAAYRIRLGSLAVLVLNREALQTDSGVLQADGHCLDVLVLPARADPKLASALLRALRPRLVVLPPPQTGAPALSPALLHASRSTRFWSATNNAALSLGPGEGTCASDG